MRTLLALGNGHWPERRAPDNLCPLRRSGDAIQSVSETPKPLYPALYSWQVAYQLPDASVVFCSCFREAWFRYFDFLKEKFVDDLEKAFLRFSWSVNPATIKAFAKLLAMNRKSLMGKNSFFVTETSKSQNLTKYFGTPPSGFFALKIKSVRSARDVFQNISTVIRCMAAHLLKSMVRGLELTSFDKNIFYGRVALKNLTDVKFGTKLKTNSERLLVSR
jgi:hypothetical protein